MTIVSNEIYRIKSLGYTYSTYFNYEDKYYYLLPKMNTEYIVKKIGDGRYKGLITTIDFVKKDEFFHCNAKNILLFLLYNSTFDIYVLIEDKHSIKL